MMLIRKTFFKKLTVVFITIALIIGGSIWQQRVLQVKAAVQVLLVSDTAIPFGTVFPGESAEHTYFVQLDTSAQSALYVTTLEPVAGKLDLCPLLDLHPVDVLPEGDTLPASHLTKALDVQDNWQVSFSAPAIKGHVSQDHRGRIVVEAGDYECKIIITTTSQPDNRRMTGGGSVFKVDGTRITHGFELHCDILVLPNRLEVNWPASPSQGGPGSGKGKNLENNFHLEVLTSAICTDDPALHAEQPNNTWDTYTGTGTGKLNGVNGATASWVFTDDGEPGKKDSMTITIKDPLNNTVLFVSGHLDVGNQQAH